MEAHEIRPAISAMTLDVDRCARSGLKMTAAFSTIYTPDLVNIRPFYADLLGPEHIKFETDDMTVYELPGGHNVLLQKVDKESPFAELKGKQSFGFATATDIKDADMTLSWADAHRLLSDPDGNTVLLANADEAILKDQHKLRAIK